MATGMYEFVYNKTDMPIDMKPHTLALMETILQMKGLVVSFIQPKK